MLTAQPRRGSNWMIDAQGHEHYLSGIDATHNEYRIETISHACAQINRFTGHCIRPYSVAEHQLLCADLAERLELPPIAQLACLMHDAHEAFVGDVSAPVKGEIYGEWQPFEAEQARMLRRWFGLQSAFVSWREQVHAIDMLALATERRDLTAYRPGKSLPWACLDTPGREVPPADWIDLRTMKREQTHWSEWAALYLQRFHALRSLANNASASAMREVTGDQQ